MAPHATAIPTMEVNLGQTTTYLPLTTAFPSSAGCENLMWKVVESTVAAWDPGYGVSVDSKVRCQPPEVTSWWLSQSPRMTIDLGPVVCPDAYTTATTEATVIDGTTRTFVACCPSEYAFDGVQEPGNVDQCKSRVREGQVLTYRELDSDKSTWTTQTETVTQYTVVWGVQVNGWIFPTGTSTTKPISSSTVSSSSRDAGTNLGHLRSKSKLAEASPAYQKTTTSVSHPQSSDSGGLSSGAGAGIAIGVVFGIVAIAAAAFLLFKYRRKRPDESNIAEVEGNDVKACKDDAASVGKSSMDNYEMAAYSKTTYEMAQPATPTELA